MASSRASSPAADARSPSPELLTPELLTPRSKIKALLATVESSDDEQDAVVSNKNRRKQSFVAGPRNRPDEESDESDVTIRPRGKLASRMQGAARERAENTLDDEESDATQRQTRKNADADRGEDSDDDDDLPVAPRRLKRCSSELKIPADPEHPAREPSPGLFVSSPLRPSPANNNDRNDSESDQELPALKSDRFKALVERKRQERLAREASEEARKAEQRARQEKLAFELDRLGSDDGADSGITDDEGGRRLTQKARPTRKASKKAVEEMNRETQRMARNMQLAHEAKTRKKISKASLFERFNFRPAGGSHPEPKTHSSSRPTTPQSDVEWKDADTPPSSPPVVAEQELPRLQVNQDADAQNAGDDELPSLDQVMDLAVQSPPKDKGKAIAIDVQDTSKKTPKPKRRVRVRLPAATLKASTLDSDDELEVKCTTKDKVDAVFNRIPAQGDKESRSLRALRALALVRSPGKQGRQKQANSSMTAAELQAQLYQRARQQARLERDRRLEMLKAQGVVIQTADEPREEAQKIMQQERAAAKKEKEEGGSVDPLAWDDSEDDEYAEAADEADGEASAIELSDSDTNSEEEGEESDEPGNGTVSEHDEDPDQLPVAKQRRTRKHTTILSDDEADIEATPKPKPKAAQTTPAEARTAFPAVPTSGPAGLGLTQIFAGTMDDSQIGGPTQSMMPDFDQFLDSNFTATAEEPAEEMIMDTQREETPTATQGTQGIHLNLTQSQMRGLDSLLPNSLHTQVSESMEPSQDAGLQEQTPLRERFVEPPFSTVETIPADQQGDEFVHDSPLVRRGRLRRKMDMAAVGEEETQATQVNAFRVLAEGAKERKHPEDEFDRKKTKAKDMVEDQAEESEDEYAGLGGADGEGSDNESTGSLEEIIDDAKGNDVDEGELAAFYADRERANDEMEVEKLFKDITTGMLRRKRGADYDLSDSDDGGEARRRMKRRQFSKMQKALYTDERVKKMAENPGNQAFLRTIEDRGSEDEMDLLDMADAPEEADTQSQPQGEGGGGGDTEARQGQKTIPDSQPGKQPLGASEQGRAPGHMRRTAGGKKPSNIGQIRDTLSDLLEERQGSVIPATEAGSESEDEGDDEHDDRGASRRSNKENQAPSAPRRGVAVVDRISLKRNSSCMSSTSSTRLAFAAHASASSSSFKVPALLRRATTNSTRMSGSASTAASSTTATTGAGGFGDDGKIKKGAGKQSGVVSGGLGAPRHGEGREPMAQAGARRREERKARGAVSRVGVVGGLLARGSFE
ncbi:MRC1-like domain-containing protein [Hirsutella rhossiliensis]|uniref:MRC1-like domain-containing protein n=1 Tax=Hirsutella rhossiliensis TaxID=111463 RepID=A0A9P8SGM6_9HYPO|nr:MRC1-like domain-containing protein [Hirsutella rhossiliensis]KAH0961951.1 MRC1-like domain-containing protein [Hirsutella rhossiliensis]